LKIGSYEITKSAPEQIPDKPPANLFVEISRGDSPWYTLNTLKPYNPDAIYQKKGDYSTFDEIREDDQINAILSLKKFMILDSKWEVECENEEIIEFINYNLSGPFLDEIFEKKLFNILTALDYGFSITEKVFSRLDTKFGKKIVLTGLKTRPPHTIEIDQNEFGDIVQFRQKVYGSDLVIDPSKIIFYSYRKEFDNPYGRPEINLGVYRAWWSKNAIVKFYNIYLERFGMPTITGTYPQHMSKEKDNLLKVIKNIQAKAGIVVPEGIIISTVGEKASGESGYKEAIDITS
jgi:phage gp29-like protein